MKNNPPKKIKISPISAIEHKSRAYRAILDLSFVLRLLSGKTAPLVNEKTTKTDPHTAIDQIGHALQRLIHAFAEAPDDAKVFMAKWDIKDGFWRLCNQIGDKWNFCYVLPQEEGATPKILVRISL